MMKRISFVLVAIACLTMLSTAAFAQLPNPTYGWNLGNTMEAPSGVGTWSPAPTQALINAVAAAGFNTIRIPCAWDSHANQTTYQIDPTYMSQVKQVVDWCYAKGLYVVVNDHWDDGWLENNITTSVNPTINAKMNAYWTQIANTFVGYDYHLLFAGANEPNVSTSGQMSTLITYYDTFIKAVRGTGGNNTSRWLVVEGPGGADIDTTNSLMTSLPSDPTPGRLMVEVHYYSPYQYALMAADASWGNMFYFWGNGYHSTTLTSRNSTWGEESYVDSEFAKMQNQFTSKGIPVLLGEFGSVRRTSYSDLTGANLTLHLASRTYFDKYIVSSANSHGMRPVYWDDGGLNNNSMGLFNRSTSTLSDTDSARALTGGPALSPSGSIGSSYSSNISNGNHAVVPQNDTSARLDANGWSASNGTKVQIWNGSTQTWAFTNKGNGIYQIAEAWSPSACLDVYNGGGSGTKTDIWGCWGGSMQQWGAISDGGNVYEFEPQCAKGTRLDVVGAGSSSGTQVDIWTANGGSNQKWAVN